MNRVDPIEALNTFTVALNSAGSESVALTTEPRGFLVESITLESSTAPQASTAAYNGYAVDATVVAGSDYAWHGVMTVSGDRYSVEGVLVPESSPRADGLWRVETGAELPAGADRVIPVSGAVLSGPGRVSLIRTVGAGVGVVARASGRSPLTFSAGTTLDARLSALFLAYGVREVVLRRPPTVAVASIGDELIDLEASLSVAARRYDLTGYWLGEPLRGLGAAVLPLGILPDSAERLADVIRQAPRRGCTAVLVAGGLGDGFTDRLVETLQALQARIFFAQVDLNGGLGLLLAKTQGVDIIGLSGHPLWAAALFDLFVRPAFLSQLGAPRCLWDWRETPWPAEIAARSRVSDADQTAPTEAEITWSVLPMLPGGVDVSPNVESPIVAGQVGWLIQQHGNKRSEPPFFCPNAPTKPSL